MQSASGFETIKERNHFHVVAVYEYEFFMHATLKAVSFLDLTSTSHFRNSMPILMSKIWEKEEIILTPSEF